MSDMGHCYGNDLRRRVVEAITGRLSARGAAARFRVAPATAIHWHRRWRETGSIEPDRQGQPPGSKLDAHEAFILALVAQTKAMTLAEIGEKLVASHGVRVCPSTVWHFFAKRGLTHKKRELYTCLPTGPISSILGSFQVIPFLLWRPAHDRPCDVVRSIWDRLWHYVLNRATAWGGFLVVFAHCLNPSAFSFAINASCDRTPFIELQAAHSSCRLSR